MIVYIGSYSAYLSASRNMLCKLDFGKVTLANGFDKAVLPDVRFICPSTPGWWDAGICVVIRWLQHRESALQRKHLYQWQQQAEKWDKKILRKLSVFSELRQTYTFPTPSNIYPWISVDFRTDQIIPQSLKTRDNLRSKQWLITMTIDKQINNH